MTAYEIELCRLWREIKQLIDKAVLETLKKDEDVQGELINRLGDVKSIIEGR